MISFKFWRLIFLFVVMFWYLYAFVFVVFQQLVVYTSELSEMFFLLGLIYFVCYILSIVFFETYCLLKECLVFN